jgi:hypothetical protein
LIRLLEARLGNALGPDAPDAAGAGRIKKRKTFGEPTSQRFTEAAGRFVDLLPVNGEDAAAAGGLHSRLESWPWD